ncbi:hypothetical protein LINGRAHAP2_LOCUS31329 [Linum grandiflorum]
MAAATTTVADLLSSSPPSLFFPLFLIRSNPTTAAAAITSRRRSPPLSFRSSGGGGDLAPSPSLSLSLVCAGKRGCRLSSPLSSPAAATKEAAASLGSLAQVTVDEDGQHSPEFVSDEVG